MTQTFFVMLKFIETERDESKLMHILNLYELAFAYAGGWAKKWQDIIRCTVISKFSTVGEMVSIGTWFTWRTGKKGVLIKLQTT